MNKKALNKNYSIQSISSIKEFIFPILCLSATLTIILFGEHLLFKRISDTRYIIAIIIFHLALSILFTVKEKHVGDGFMVSILLLIVLPILYWCTRSYLEWEVLKPFPKTITGIDVGHEIASGNTSSTHVIPNFDDSHSGYTICALNPPPDCPIPSCPQTCPPGFKEIDDMHCDEEGENCGRSLCCDDPSAGNNAALCLANGGNLCFLSDLSAEVTKEEYATCSGIHDALDYPDDFTLKSCVAGGGDPVLVEGKYKANLCAAVVSDPCENAVGTSSDPVGGVCSSANPYEYYMFADNGDSIMKCCDKPCRLYSECGLQYDASVPPSQSVVQRPLKRCHDDDSLNLSVYEGTLRVPKTMNTPGNTSVTATTLDECNARGVGGAKQTCLINQDGTRDGDGEPLVPFLPKSAVIGMPSWVLSALKGQPVDSLPPSVKQEMNDADIGVDEDNRAHFSIGSDRLRRTIPPPITRFDDGLFIPFNSSEGREIQKDEDGNDIPDNSPGYIVNQCDLRDPLSDSWLQIPESIVNSFRAKGQPAPCSTNLIFVPFHKDVDESDDRHESKANPGRYYYFGKEPLNHPGIDAEDMDHPDHADKMGTLQLEEGSPFCWADPAHLPKMSDSDDVKKRKDVQVCAPCSSGSTPLFLRNVSLGEPQYVWVSKFGEKAEPLEFTDLAIYLCNPAPTSNQCGYTPVTANGLPRAALGHFDPELNRCVCDGPGAYDPSDPDFFRSKPVFVPYGYGSASRCVFDASGFMEKEGSAFFEPVLNWAGYDEDEGGYHGATCDDGDYWQDNDVDQARGWVQVVSHNAGSCDSSDCVGYGCRGQMRYCKSDDDCNFALLPYSDPHFKNPGCNTKECDECIASKSGIANNDDKREACEAEGKCHDEQSGAEGTVTRRFKCIRPFVLENTASDDNGTLLEEGQPLNEAIWVNNPGRDVDPDDDNMIQLIDREGSNSNYVAGVEKGLGMCYGDTSNINRSYQFLGNEIKDRPLVYSTNKDDSYQSYGRYYASQWGTGGESDTNMYPGLSKEQYPYDCVQTLDGVCLKTARLTHSGPEPSFPPGVCNK